MSPLATRLAPILAARALAWVEGQRALHRETADPLGHELRRDLEPWFEGATLAEVRIRIVDAIDPPRLAWLARRLGFGTPLDPKRLWGITFVDTVVIAERVPRGSRPSLLFHECVHVAQYRLLGARGFLEAYLHGWLEGGREYRAIPLEIDAYALQRRFVEGREPMSVEAEVARRLTARGRGGEGTGSPGTSGGRIG